MLVPEVNADAIPSHPCRRVFIQASDSWVAARVGHPHLRLCRDRSFTNHWPLTTGHCIVALEVAVWD